MFKNLNVVIVVSRCSRTKKCFGIRTEEADRNFWIMNWAFQIPEKTAEKEGFSRNQITGTFRFATEYPGCPFCEAISLSKCSCGKIACWDGKTVFVTCPWCNSIIQLDDEIKNLDSGTDR